MTIELKKEKKVTICLIFVGWGHGIIHCRSKWPLAYPRGSSGAWGKNGRGKNRWCHAFMDRSANGTRSRCEEAFESWCEGRCHQTRKSRIIGQREEAGIDFSKEWLV